MRLAFFAGNAKADNTSGAITTTISDTIMFGRAVGKPCIQQRFMFVTVRPYWLNLLGLWITKLPGDSVRWSRSKISLRILSTDLCSLCTKSNLCHVR